MSDNKSNNDTKERSRVILKSGWLFILVNFLLAVFNFVVGIISNSLAIASDAVHSLIDAVSGVLIIISEKIASRHKNVELRNKIERGTTVAIAIIILLVGLEVAVSSVKEIITPSEVDYSTPTIIILIVSVIVKWAFALYLKKKGTLYKSDVLNASGAETLNDALISVVVLFAAEVHILWGLNIEAYVSAAISVIIFKVGLEFIFPHISHHHHHPLDVHPDHDHCGKNH